MFVVIRGNIENSAQSFAINTKFSALFPTKEEAEQVAKKWTMKYNKKHYVVSLLNCFDVEKNIVKTKMK